MQTVRLLNGFMHAEETGLPDFDLVTLQFVIHELPRQATTAILGKPYGSYVPWTSGDHR